MIYKPEAFRFYDEIFCTGPYHIDELRECEKINNWPQKALFPHGYGKLDQLLENMVDGVKITESPTILLAPSWGDQAIIPKCAKEIINTLLSHNFRVIFRPHYESFKYHPDYIKKIEEKFVSNSHFIFESNMSQFESFKEADLMISDWSGAALEFAFGCEKPVLFIDLPRKIQNPNYEQLSCEPIEVQLRNKIGIIVPLEEIDMISKYAEKILSQKEIFKKEIRSLREKWVYHIGNSSKIGAKRIIEIASFLKSS